MERRVAAKRKRAAEASSSSSNVKLEEAFDKSMQISEKVEAPVVRQPPSLASMFLVIMSIFAILNQIYYKPTAQS